MSRQDGRRDWPQAPRRHLKAGEPLHFGRCPRSDVVRTVPKQIDRDYRGDSPTFAPERPQCFIQEIRIQVAEARITVHEHGGSAGIDDGVRRRGECHRGYNHDAVRPGTQLEQPEM